MTVKTTKRAETAHSRDISEKDLITEALALAVDTLVRESAWLEARNPASAGVLVMRERAKSMSALLEMRS